MADEISEASPDSPTATSMPSMGPEFHEDFGSEFRNLQSRECSKSLPETECNWALKELRIPCNSSILFGCFFWGVAKYGVSEGFLTSLVFVCCCNSLESKLAVTSLDVWRQAQQPIEEHELNV